MAKTRSRYQQDLGFPDGIVRYGPSCTMVTGGAAPLVRNAASDFSLNMGASITTSFAINLLDGELVRSGFAEDLMEQFGGSQIAGAAEPQFTRPDLIPAMNTGQQLLPRSINKTKGLKLTGLAILYAITGAALTAHTLQLNRTVYANNVANAITNLVASGANGLATATQANPYVTVITLPAAAQVYYNTDLTDLVLEVSATTQVAGVYRFYGARALFEFNFN